MQRKKPSKRSLGRRVIEFVAVFLFGYLLLCFVLARSYVQPSRVIPTRPDDLAEVQIPIDGHASDPAWATAHLADGQKGGIVFVLAHGYGGTRDTWSALMPRLAAQGIEAVAPAMPGQDASPEPSVGFGMKEADTLVAAAKWARKQAPGAKIVYAGVSMGGAAAWLASEKDPTADGVVSEGAYARFDEAMVHWFERKTPGASVYLRPVIWFASAMAGLKPSDVVPLNAAKKWKGRPALVIQAGADDLIVQSHADRLSEASGAPLWVVPDAAHAMCYDIARDEYVNRLVKFAKALPDRK